MLDQQTNASINFNLGDHMLMCCNVMMLHHTRTTFGIQYVQGYHQTNLEVLPEGRSDIYDRLVEAVIGKNI